jgi:hypothetical protein
MLDLPPARTNRKLLDRASKIGAREADRCDQCVVAPAKTLLVYMAFVNKRLQDNPPQ